MKKHRASTEVAAELRMGAAAAFSLGNVNVGASLLVEAAEHIEALITALIETTKVFATSADSARRQRDEIVVAFAKFDSEDWDFLLGEKEYGPMQSSRPYQAGRGGRERVWQEALGVLRKICEAAAPKEPEGCEPSDLARLFVKRWGSHLTPAEQEEIALSFDHEVAGEMLRSAE